MKNKRMNHIKVGKFQTEFLIWHHSQKKTESNHYPKGFTFRLKGLGLAIFLFEYRAKLKSPSEIFPPLTYLLTYYSRINDSFVTKQTYYDAAANIYLETIQCTVLLPAH